MGVKLFMAFSFFLNSAFFFLIFHSQHGLRFFSSVLYHFCHRCVYILGLFFDLLFFCIISLFSKKLTSSLCYRHTLEILLVWFCLNHGNKAHISKSYNFFALTVHIEVMSIKYVIVLCLQKQGYLS